MKLHDRTCMDPHAQRWHTCNTGKSIAFMWPHYRSNLGWNRWQCNQRHTALRISNIRLILLDWVTYTNIVSDDYWLYVMRSRESVGSRTCDIFSFLFHWSDHLETHILLKTPLDSVQWFQGYEQLKSLRTIENNRNPYLLLAISRNQYGRLPTDPARSQHIYTLP